MPRSLKNVRRAGRVADVTAFDLDAGQHELLGWVREVGVSRLTPIADAGEPGRVNRELLKAMGDLGLLTRLFPGVADGRATREAAALDLCLLRESLAGISTEAETALALQGLGTYPVLQSGSPDQVARWVPAVAAGDEGDARR